MVLSWLGQLIEWPIVYSSSGAKKFLVGIIAASSLVITACSYNPNEGNETEVQGNATPASSPQDTDPAGNVEEYGEISDIAHVGDTIAVRSDDTITFGAPDSLGNPLKISPSCGDLNSSAGFFFIGCGDKVYKIDPNNPSDPRVIPVEVDFAVTAATELSSGELFLASNETKDIVIYKDGEVIDDFTVEEPSDQLLAVPNQDGVDNVIRINREATTIQNLDWENSREGGRLRAGIGLGQGTVGEDGTILVSDTLGGRLMVYTSEDVVRQHQFGPVDGSPWGVAWDEKRQIAWVTTTDNNLVHGFNISTGVPELVTTLGTVADAQSIQALDNRDLVLGSATGAGLQVIPAADIDDSVENPK